ncbi:putative T7SS-secreted protein [Streptomyces physcomitrii]|uniref:Putative T7SS secretion signal domain-containing protein n=2 Tax=Streptomyces TaxID=1883 RepID=A0A0B5EN96_STRA4|nr:hypothetical protein [Streptomyces physcomitrii]AJE83089.1 hypothetical protein SLNWT_2713 [Streptomyces albus]AOU77399.1 hypothetical protein SLNHY_2708 [Streptomyces albus]AYN33173.1 hypothetical protein DUI70_2672 [Streptomyces albus]NKI44340.1 hypothetical protein [Streptomyces physcomitrii]
MSRPKDWEPLHDGDPTPGDPYEVARLGKKLRTMADEIDKQSRNIKALASVEGWDSDAGRAFHDIAGDTSARLKRAYDRYDEAALALGTKVNEGDSETGEYASELHRAQKVADKALRDFREAEGSHKSAIKGLEPHQGKVPASKEDASDRAKMEKQRDEAWSDIRDAHGEIARAKQIRDDAANSAAKKIKNIIHHDGVRDPGGFFNFLADWADAFANLSAVFSVLAVICAFVPPLQVLAPVFAALAVISSAAALAGHAYDMFARGGKLNLLKLGLDVLGVVPGLGVIKGFGALRGLKGLSLVGRAGRFARGVKSGVSDKFFNGIAVKGVNWMLGKAGKPLIEGKKITAAIKGAGFGSALHKVFTGHNGASTGDPGDSYKGPTPKPSPGPAPTPSPSPFHTAVATG